MGVRHAKVGPRVADRIAYLERIAGDESLATRKDPAFDTRVRITIVSYLARLRDADGTSGKAAIDGLVHAGVIADDSPKYVEEVCYRQVKVKTKAEQKTQIIIEAVD
ncbi:hypothetical protein VN12_19755 [Pirellula sp. SH-Sr6A]|uniref:hypothetical protein n=1 Tax=Pirellula sp. SH-Sr6A TaxID=1632865 RepID=UPI00078E02DD|nr:hypothetical protein [Pirellula sp. SH-Sr6A]AMV34371.1 hypothetical protein VN12_19755 [Pirellula sp. SH-Sr6A]